MQELSIVKKFSDYKLAVINNDLIESRYDMSTNQLKLFIALVSQIQPVDNDFKTVKVTAESLMKIFNITNKKDIYAVTNLTSRKLMQQIIEIEDPERKFFERYSLFSKMRYENGLLTVRFSEDMRPFLLILRKEFTKFKLKEFKPFTSKYSIRIYQLLKQYQNIGKRAFEITDLRTMLHIDKKQLKNFYNFSKYVLKIAQKELENTPMAFDWEPIKRGRGGKVVEVIFKLKNKKKKEITTDNNQFNYTKVKETEEIKEKPKEDKKTIASLLKRIPANKRSQKIENLLAGAIKKWSVEYISKQIGYVLNAADRKTVGNLVGYLFKALEKDWAGAEKSKAQIEIEQAQQTKAIEKQRLEEEQERRKKEQELENRQKWDDLPEEQKEAWIQKIAENSRLIRGYIEKGIKQGFEKHADLFRAMGIAEMTKEFNSDAVNVEIDTDQKEPANAGEVSDEKAADNLKKLNGMLNFK